MADDLKINKTVLQVFKILDAINNATNPVGVSELTRMTALPKTTVFRLLSTLEYLDAVEANSLHQYKIGTKILAYAKSVDHQNSLVKVAKPYMKQFAAATHENINIGILYENQVLYLDSEEGEQFNLQVNLFPVAPLYCSSMGKIFLSAFTSAELAHYLDQTELHMRTVNTLVTPDQLKQAVTKVATEHLAYDNEEYEYGLTCIAVPIYQQGKLIASASVSGPTSRLKVRGWSYIKQSIIDFGETINNLL
ncbi:IclR family transcriptional regulator [Lactiplantibacillus plantarum]|uniref:IclR family transcriptional regulator n=1 Tax=Lactiplantibacillus plantarum TaxID=1590 RepID=UPI00200150ED|nr:IclR family transcriptional regulator [Lactiplantibacillus plantarum]MCK3677931.1 IclR family transcriptional regulator [Lactiplantibacillus plantarum]